MNGYLPERVGESEDDAPICEVDRIDLSQSNDGASLSPSVFYKDYIRLNKPVLIKLPEKMLISDDMVQDWSREAMVGKNDVEVNLSISPCLNALTSLYAFQQVILSSIPYGSLFGEKEEHWPLSEYFTYLDSFSQKVESLSPYDYYLSNSDNKEKVDSVGGIHKVDRENIVKQAAKDHVKPLYLFGNSQQVSLASLY